ncbi:MAG TPA: hypothetical protein VGF92_02670 [Stellaceae bacterium]|jgi:hypothetical protein
MDQDQTLHMVVELLIGGTLAVALASIYWRLVPYFSGAMGIAAGFAAAISSGRELSVGGLATIIGYGILGAVTACSLRVIFVGFGDGRLRDLEKEPIGFFADLAWPVRRRIVPSLWSGVEVSSNDLARRAFVAITAATGGIVGRLVALDQFVDALRSAFSAGGIFIALVMTLVSAVLIRPLHEYVLQRGVSAGTGPQGESAEQEFRIEHVTWRSGLRLGLVFILLLELDVLYGAVEETMRAGAVNAMFQTLVGGIVPGVVSYYWSAGIQLQLPPKHKAVVMPSFLDQTTRSSIAMLAVIIFPTVWFETRGALSVLVSAPLALLQAALICGAYAVLGGYVIERYQSAQVMRNLSIAIIVGAIVPQIVSIIYEGIIGEPPNYYFHFTQAIGWVLGLWASGFPRLLRTRTPSSEAPPTLQTA